MQQTSTLSNFAAGVMILLYRPYEIGDVVTVSGTTGKVKAMTLVSTTVVTPDFDLTVDGRGHLVLTRRGVAAGQVDPARGRAR